MRHGRCTRRDTSLINGNRFDGVDGRDIIAASLVVHNRIEENGDAGIYVEGNDNRVLFNEVKGNASKGIALLNASARNLVDNNKVAHNRFTGIFLAQDTADNAVRANKLKRNTPVDLAVPPGGYQQSVRYEQVGPMLNDS